MEEIQVRKHLLRLYEEITEVYCTGYYNDIAGYNIVFSEDHVNMQELPAKEYLDIYTEEDGKHWVYDIIVK